MSRRKAAAAAGLDYRAGVMRAFASLDSDAGILLVSFTVDRGLAGGMHQLFQIGQPIAHSETATILFGKREQLGTQRINSLAGDILRKAFLTKRVQQPIRGGFVQMSHARQVSQRNRFFSFSHFFQQLNRFGHGVVHFNNRNSISIIKNGDITAKVGCQGFLLTNLVVGSCLC